MAGAGDGGWNERGQELEAEDAVDRSVPVRNYDVFINHRGPDVKKTFVSHLSAALKKINFIPFVDCDEIQEGDRSWETIQSAIRHSKVNIAVFSPRYAESEWCLDELCLLLKCHAKKSSCLFLPVFYNVEPSTLRLTPGSYYNSCFEKGGCHGKKPATDINRWKEALSEASKFSGYVFPSSKIFQGYESGLVEKIVSKVLDVLSRSTLLHGAEYPVGLDEQLKHVLHLMKIDEGQRGVKKFGIWGMGGVGKTTLAKSIYNRIHREFDSACFIESVSENFKAGNGQALQLDLLEELLKGHNIRVHTIARGQQILRHRLVGKKVLIILDDVNEMDQYYALLPPYDCGLREGSQIVITTQDMDILNRADVKAKHKISELKSPLSYQLFNRHAFPHLPKDKPLGVFKQFAEKVADACDGLPLALIVLGSHLRGKDISEWELTVKALESMSLTTPQREVTAKLQISFDALRSAEEKQMFLDIACFLLGEHKDKGIRIWSSEYGDAGAKLHLENLKRKCLVKVDEDGKFTMHGLLRDMGREIVVKSQDILWQRSHLWREVEVDHILEACKGTSHVRGLSSNAQRVWETKSFAGMDELKLLVLSNVTLTGDFSKISQQLRWFQLRHFPLDDFNVTKGLKKAAILDFGGSRIKRFTCDDGTLQSLKELNLGDCSNLEELPDFGSSCKSLEALIISGCEKLERIPNSIGELGSSLVYLDMSSCSNLKTLPDGISSLSVLTTLLLNKCSALTRLPDDIGKLTALQKIGLDEVPLSTLPQSFGNLSNLVALHLNHSLQLRELPSTISNLRKLTSLNIISCPLISEIPEGVTNLTDLVHFRVSGCRLVPQLPENIGELKKLVELQVSGSEQLLSLPSSIHLLSNLEGLNLNGCPNLSEVQGLPTMLTSLDIGGCSSVKKVDMSWCRKLMTVPDGIEDLTSLTTLLMDNCTGITKLPDAIGQLTALETIGFNRVPLCTLPQSFSDLCNLVALRLHHSPKLTELPSTVGNLKKLTSLDIMSCPLIPEIPQGVTNLTNLVYFRILDCDAIAGLPKNIWNLRKLSEFHVSDNLKISIFLPPSIIQLEQLVKLKLSSCNIGNDGIPTTGYSALSSLKSVNLSGNRISSLPRDFGNLPNLEKLKIKYCGNLCEVSHLPPTLTSLNMSGCSKLERITCLSSLTKLSRLELRKCTLLLQLNGLECLFGLMHLNISGCRSLVELPRGLDNLTSLKTFRMAGSGVPVLQDVESPWIQKMVSLESVSLSGQDTPDSLKDGYTREMDVVYVPDIGCKGVLCCYVSCMDITAMDSTWVQINVYNRRLDKTYSFTLLSDCNANDYNEELQISIFRASHPLVTGLEPGSCIYLSVSDDDYGPCLCPQVRHTIIKLMSRENEMEETLQKLSIRQPTL